MASPIRRRLAAIVTCLALAFATFGYMQRSASEAVSEAPPAVDCREARQDLPKQARHPALGCLTLLDG